MAASKRPALHKRPAVDEVHSEVMTIDGREIHLSSPVRAEDRPWIGSSDVKRQLAAAWLCIDKTDKPMNPRLVGPPGLGKTTLACAIARETGRPLYIFQCSMDTRPEDLVISPVLIGDSKIRYQASPLASAVLKGGVCLLDEGNRMREKAWATLAPLLDHRRYLESQVANIKLYANRGFRFCTTMNDDVSFYQLPEFIQTRLKPKIELTFPSPETQEKIIRANVTFVQAELITRVVEFLSQCHKRQKSVGLRDGILLAG